MSDAPELQRAQQRARRRAERAVCAAHPDEFAARFHEEKHRARISHIHGPDDPETITWWGSAKAEAQPVPR